MSSGTDSELKALRATLEPAPGYEWSTDYDLALRLLEGGRLFGVALYDTLSDGHKLFDPCGIRRLTRGGYDVGVRGLSYFDANGAEDFKALCAKYEVRFLTPHDPSAASTALQCANEMLETSKKDVRYYAAAWVEQLKRVVERTKWVWHAEQELQCANAMLEEAKASRDIAARELGFLLPQWDEMVNAKAVAEEDLEEERVDNAALRALAGRMLPLLRDMRPNCRALFSEEADEIDAILEDARKIGVGE